MAVVLALLAEGSKQQLLARSIQGGSLPHSVARGSSLHSTPKTRSWDERNRKRRLRFRLEGAEPVGGSGWR